VLFSYIKNPLRNDRIGLMPAIDKYLSYIFENGFSDLHVVPNVPVIGRLDGDLIRISTDQFDAKTLDTILYEIISVDEKDHLKKHSNVDFSYEISGVSRFRVNYYFHSGGLGATFRVIPVKIPTISELGLNESILESTQYKNGLVLVTGPTGSGKTSTLAALLNYINTNRPDHIITIEDPIEFIHSNNLKGLVSQREVGKHTKSFSSALRSALREDPDVIMVGEMRDMETIELAITAAETGHLVFASLHTNSASKTIDRLVDVFPDEGKDEIRTLLADTLRAVISQVLVKKIGGRGRLPVQEIMFVNHAVSNLIREGKSYQIEDVIQTSPNEGMLLMKNEMDRLNNEKKIGIESIY